MSIKTKTQVFSGFLSYSHIDKDWVDAMHDRLVLRLAELLGEQPKIWRDLQLKGDDEFANVLVLELSNVAFLVSVLSPGYVKSDWCLRELNEFCRRADKSGKLRLNKKSRVFKVVKSPIDDLIEDKDSSPSLQVLRELLHKFLGYEFYERDGRSGKLREFRPELGHDSLQKFLAKLEDLIVDIRDFIKSQQTAEAEISAPNAIYLAETTPDLTEERNEIKRTLQLHSYRVLPDESLPFDDDAFGKKVEAFLKESLLSIHLVGADYTTLPGDENLRAKLTLQHQIAAERVRRQHEIAMIRGENEASYTRLIWMPEGLKAQDQNYQRFIDYLENDPGVYEGAEVLCGIKLEDLKTIIQERLEGKLPDGGQKSIYVICDRQDLQAVAPLQAFLKEKYKVALPFSADSQVVIGHKDNLRNCDGVMVFYGSVDTMEWRLKDLRRIEGYRETKPAIGIYIAGPETEQKRVFASPDALVMKNFGPFSPDSIQPFLDELESASSKGGRA